jgi:hypothetical protein
VIEEDSKDFWAQIKCLNPSPLFFKGFIVREEDFWAEQEEGQRV